MNLDRSQLKPGEHPYCAFCHARKIINTGKSVTFSCDTSLLDGIKHLQPSACQLPKVIYSTRTTQSQAVELLQNHVKDLRARGLIK